MEDISNIVLPRLPAEPLGTSGRWITDAGGRVLIFRGLNMMNKLPPYTLSATGFGEADAALLAANGFNVVRVGVIYSAVEPAPGVYDHQYLTDIRQTVGILASHGIMSVIDFHQDGWGPSFICEGFPEWATLTDGHPIRPIGAFPGFYQTSKAFQRAFANFWDNAPGPGGVGLQDRFAAAWAVAVEALKSSKGILGWEILNEPFPGTHYEKLFTPPFKDGQLDAALTSFTQKVVNAIRTQDTDHIIWYEPWVSFDEGIPTYIGPISDPAPTRRIGMAFHNYRNTTDDYHLVWKNALEHSHRTGDALLATEFGACTEGSLIVAEMNSVDRVMMPAIYWAYSNRTPYAIVENKQPVSAAAMGIVYDPTQPLVAGNVSEDKLNALTRPYPMLIAGTPLAWSFDPRTLTFQLEYGRTPEGKGTEPKGATQIFVPTRRYPKGCTVAVVGGKQLPTNDAQTVLILNDAGAETVTVTITPAG